MKHILIAAALTAAVCTSAPARAADDTTEKVALLSYLGLTAATGKTELGEHGGELESWIAASGLMGKAACKIGQAIGLANEDGSQCVATGAATPILVLGDSESFDFSAYLFVTSQTKAAADALAGLPAKCRPVSIKSTGPTGLDAVDPNTIPAAILALAKTDSKVTGVVIEVKERAFINAVAGVLGSRAILTDGFMATRTRGVDSAWNDVRASAAKLATGACKDTPAAKAALAVYEETKKGFFEKGEKGTLFERARALEPIAASAIPERVLRVRVEYTGGTIINQSNILTTLGAPALSLSGGMVVSYRYTNSTTGTVEKAGVIICRAGVRKLHSFNNPKNPTNFGECAAV